MSHAASWTATIVVRPPGRSTAGWLAQALAPEAAREVPRARARISERADGTLAVEVEAADAGALRAAVNTYLGWLDLALATLDSAATPSRGK